MRKKAERKIWKKLEKALEARVKETRFCDEARKELQELCGIEIAGIFWQDEDGYVARVHHGITGSIPVNDLIKGSGTGHKEKKRKAEGECMDTVKKLREFFNCTAELFISCLALLFILPLLYLLAALSGQLFTEIWEIREYKYKTDKKNSTESGKKISLTVNCQPSAANGALEGKVK